MATYTETISLADCVLGDRWIGISQIDPQVNSQDPDNDLARVRMEFRLGQTSFVLDSKDGDVSIDSANAWEASIAARDDFLPLAGKWKWAMFFYQAGVDTPWKLYEGEITVHPRIG